MEQVGEGSGALRVIVGVGASAGGLDPLQQLVAGLRSGFGLCLVVVQHLDPSHPSALPDLLAAHSALPVSVARDGQPLEADTVVVAPPGFLVSVHEGRLRLGAAPSGAPASVDHLFRSLAERGGAGVVGVVLSGGGADGVDGLTALRDAGAITVAQDPREATHPSMPRAALDAGVVDVVVGALHIAAVLERVAAGEVPGADAPMLSDARYEILAELLQSRAGFDPAGYRPGTIRRRFAHRLEVVGESTVEAYLDRLTHDDEELHRLANDLVIGVTSFFRDPDAFETLARLVVRPLLASLAPDLALRVWVPGCATGEEAYTLGMVLLEALDDVGCAAPAIRIFATDIDEGALHLARSAVYPPESAAHLGDTRIDRFFVRRSDQRLEVRPELRKLVTFAVHDLCSDPPLPRMHLVSCRNVLIYLQPSTQERVLKALRFSLQPKGCLLLGAAESVAAGRDLFEPVSDRWRIFRALPASSASRRDWRQVPPRRVERSVSRPAPTVAELAERVVLRARVPPTVVVDQDEQVLYVHGVAEPWLRVPSGEARRDLAAMLRPDLEGRVRALVRRCRAEGGPVEAMSSPDRPPVARIAVDPAPAIGPNVVVVTFAAIPASETPPEVAAPRLDLEAELDATRLDLWSALRQLDDAEDELRRSSEAARTTSEDLQTANEELEATAEELRSLNEELAQTNSQLTQKVALLERAQVDFANFFASTRIATVFLDTELRVVRSSPEAAEVLGFDESATGRFVGERRWRDPLLEALADDANRGLDGEEPVARELRSAEDRWFVRRVLPYRANGAIEGVVVTFSDVTNDRAKSDALAVAEQRWASVARVALQALEAGDLNTLLEAAIRDTRRMLGCDVTAFLRRAPSNGAALWLRASDGLTPTAEGPVEVSPETLAGQALRTSLPVRLAPDVEVGLPDLPPVQDAIAVQIHAEADVFGVLLAGLRDGQFGPEDVSFVITLGSVIQAAVVRHQSRLRLKIEGDAAQVLAEATGAPHDLPLGTQIDRVGRRLCEVLGPHLGAATAELWWVASAGRLECRALVALAEPGREDELRTARCAGGLARGEGLPGRVWQRGRGLWGAGARRDPEAAPADPERGLGPRGALGVPVMAGGEVLGVFVCSAVDATQVDATIVRALEAVGRTVGEWVRQVEAEAERRATEARFRDIFTDAAVSLWVEDYSALSDLLDELRGVADAEAWLIARPERVAQAWRQVRVEEVNPHTVRLFEATSAEQLLGALDSVVVPETMEDFRGVLVALAAGRTLHAGETTYRTLTGGWLRVTYTVQFPAAPTPPKRVLRSVMDITPLHEARVALDRSRRWQERLLQATPDLVTVFDVDADRLVYANPGARVILGFDAEVLVHMGADFIPRLVHPDDAVGLRAYLTRTAEAPHDEITHHTFRIARADGGYRWMDMRGVPFSESEGGAARAVLSVARDVTELRRDATALEEAVREKDHFLAMLGHELRNPLAAIRTATGLLGRQADARTSTIHGVLDRQTAQMSRLVDGLLDVSRLARGRITLAHAWVDLAEVIRNVCSDHAAVIEGRSLRLREALPEGPLRVWGDPVRLTQVVDNLVSNALKFTADGEVVVAAERRDGRVEITVRDTGMGIEPELLPHLFDPFRQAQQPLDRSAGGLGLGLSLVKGLVALHGGWVEARSEGLGQGAEFRVSLPGTEVVAQPDAATAAEPAPSRAILVVEDNADAAEMLRVLLGQAGHRVEVARDGEDALERARGLGPDVVLCDIGLPGMSGYEVAQAMRADPRLRGIRLVALTGYGNPEDRERASAAGFDGHLVKPVDLADLEPWLR